MRHFTPLLLLFVLLLSACQPIVVPEAAAPAADAAAAESAEAAPMHEVNFYTSHAAHERFAKIDLASGVGTDVGKYENEELEILRAGWFAGNGAIHEDAYYVILAKRLPAGSTPEEAEARLARVDMATGAMELLGESIPLHLGAMEIDPCGQIYATGFTLSNQVGELYGDTNLYQVDRESGALTLIGDTGLERVMDMSFDPAGTLWATVENVLYTLDMETGAPTTVATITGVEEDLEIMGLGFTDAGELYGTTPFADGFYRIDTESGAVTEVGRHGLTFMHGGDIPMTTDDAQCEMADG